MVFVLLGEYVRIRVHLCPSVVLNYRIDKE